jgi:cell division protein ZapA (FtsZ GTPase activity inhibitor)
MASLQSGDAIIPIWGSELLEVRTYEREKLYKEVWAEPMIKVAQRYNVSDVALKKTCKKLNIPVPGRGYWSKVYAGEKMQKPPLPKQKEHKQVIMREYSNRQVENFKAMKKADILLFLPEDKRKEVKAFCASLVVPGELKQPHVFVRDTIQYYRSRKESTKPHKDHVFYFRTSDEQAQRAYRIWDTLFKALEQLGYTVKIESPRGQQYWNYDPPASSNVVYFQLGQDKVPVFIREFQQRVPHIPTEQELAEKKRYSFTTIPEYDYVYNGKLTFTIDEYHAKRKSWNDGKIKSIDNEIGDIVIGIMEAIHIVKERREEREVAEKRRREEEIRRWELKQKRDKEKERVNLLISKADDYYQAQKLYEYIAAIEKMLPNVQDDMQKKLTSIYHGPNKKQIGLTL